MHCDSQMINFAHESNIGKKMTCRTLPVPLSATHSYEPRICFLFVFRSCDVFVKIHPLEQITAYLPNYESHALESDTEQCMEGRLSLVR